MLLAHDYGSHCLPAAAAKYVLFNTHFAVKVHTLPVIVRLWVLVSGVLMCVFVIPFVFADDCRWKRGSTQKRCESDLERMFDRMEVMQILRNIPE
jgi:hypothetical protein